MYILICHVTFLCPPKDFSQATALITIYKVSVNSSKQTYILPPYV